MGKGITRKIKKEEEEFSRNDCNDKDFKDNGPRRRGKKGKQGEDDANQRRIIISTDFLPGSMKKLRACVHCKIVMNRQRWAELGKCPNCPSSGGLSDTTEEFHNVIG